MKRTYLSKIQEETQKFLDERIKHNLIHPERGLNLDLTIKEAEVLISANSSVKDLADKGELQKIHKKFNDLHAKVEGDYLSVRNHLGKILQQIEMKENEIVHQLKELGV